MSTFVKTSDSDTADKLIKSGMQLLNQQNGVWTFVNDPKIPMKFADNTKIIYTNKLEM